MLRSKRCMWCKVEEMVGGGWRQPLADQNSNKQEEEGGGS